MIRLPPNGDPYLTELVTILNADLDLRFPTILGWRHDGTDLHVRFRSALSTPWVQVHVQSTETGGGGATYDPNTYVSSTETDCRGDRVHDVTVPDLPYGRYVIFLVPKQDDGTGTKVLYDGQGGRPDDMVFVDIGV